MVTFEIENGSNALLTLWRDLIMPKIHSHLSKRMLWCLFVLMAVVTAGAPGQTLTLNVVDGAKAPVAGFRYLVEEDTTNHTTAGALVSDSISVDIHKSYAPVVAEGRTAGSSVEITLPDDTRYFVSVLPDEGHSISGTSVDLGQLIATVIVNQLPLPTAQIWILAFNDNFPINNAPDLPDEAGLAGFAVTLTEQFGQQMMDVFGNPLGTTYQQNPDGTFILDVEGAPIVEMMGTGVVLTDANGEALIKNLAMGKYGVQVIPPAGQNWIQTATIEGTKVIDAWVKANEPKVFVEGFGTGSYHAAFGFVKAAELPWATTPPAGTGTITGRLVYNHFAKPPFLQGFWPGEPVEGGLVGLNDPATSQGLYMTACDGDGYFTINNVPPGNYELVTWDTNLDALFGFNTVTVPAVNNPTGDAIELGNVLCFNWFGKLQGKVFYDANKNGFPDAGEAGLSDQNINLRFRNGTIYQAQPTDMNGEYAFSEVFPFFKWLVVEVDFLRFRDTGLTAIVDDGGEVLPDNGWDMPSRDALHPQPQVDTDPLSPTFGQPIINPNTGNNLSRTQLADVPGAALVQAMQLTLNQINVIDWGKAAYENGANGGISGIVYYAITRAENDPRYGVGEPWEPGIPRVQVNLYKDANANGVIDDVDGNSQIELSDVDNYPFGWQDGDPKGSEDLDRNSNGTFDSGDAIAIVSTDSWDDSMPTGSIQTLPVVHGQPVKAGFDNFATWNQVRPGVFDGGYSIQSCYPAGVSSGVEISYIPTGTYIVEATTPPGYVLVKEEDKNVDFGDPYTPSMQALPPLCVGDPHLVPAELSLFPGVECFYAGQTRPLPDRKQVYVTSGKNTPADFFFFTWVPKAARCVGFTLNDLSAEFDTTSPIFHEKAAPSWLPVSFQDWAGNELCRVYTDEWGGFNALLPSTYSINIPAPSGVAPQMITAVINDPGPIPDPDHPGEFMIDPFYDPDYAVAPWTLHYMPGSTTYLDTPIVPVAAFVGSPNVRMDIEAATGTPVIKSVEGPAGGPVICATGQQLVIKSMGDTIVPNPDYDPSNPLTTATITRDFGFGDSGTVTIGSVTLSVETWTDETIVATVDTSMVTTGVLNVTRDDTMLTSPLGVLVYIGDCDNVIHVEEGQSIQDAIDAALAGDIIAVDPGSYDENVILYKNVALLGSGANGTIIVGNPRPAEKLVAWHEKIVSLLGTDPFAANEAPVIMVLGNAGYPFAQGSSGTISGFTTSGSLSGGGIYVNSFADYLEICYNKVKGNQGNLGGGITLGTLGLTDKNVGVYVHDNQVVKNSGIDGGGGIVIYTGADNYRIENNLIQGNLTRNSGGGIDHIGLSDGGVIAGNKILNNEVFFGLLAPGGGGGGGVFIGAETATAGGAGSVTLNNNVIQGNIAGAGYGGGILVRTLNSSDEGPDPSLWYTLDIFNNMIVNNVAAVGAGGIALTDAAKVNIINNTVAENESTATGALAFSPGNLTTSNPQGAGIVSFAHSAALAAATGQTFSNPVLENNILYNNRSFYWDALLNGGNGGLVVNPTMPMWDLQVSGIAGSLNPQHCLLSDTTGYDASNASGDPMFVEAYQNNLLTAAVLDEGGNSITVRYKELGLIGNYHLAPGSAAINLGTGAYMTQFPTLYKDIDGQWRPLGSVPVDTGADELAVSHCSADFNTDCSVDLADLAILMEFWLDICPADVPCPGDLVMDNIVNLYDFSVLASQFEMSNCCQ